MTMNEQWREFLRTRSARIDDLGQARFPEAPPDAPLALCDLSHLGLIAVTGEDATHFLQGQFTNDIRLVTTTHSQLSSHCTPKGRILANFRVLRRDETLYLQLPRPQLDLLLKRLRMYVLRAKVVLTDVSDDFVTLGLSGDQTPDCLAALFPALPEQDNDLIRHGEVTLIRLAGPTPRFQMLGPVTAMTPLWDTLAATATPVDAAYWTRFDIRAGIPTIHPETREAFVPQMVNLQLIDGVSFTKGCYTGQEIVARMQYLGKLKRRLYLGEVTTDQPPRPGDEVFSPISDSAQTAGTILEAAALGDGRYEVSLVVEIAAYEDGRVALAESGPLLTLREPPYGLPAV
ncbi:MAG TPA: folate-binding protein YgfZ [Chromatiaceae bacterium]|nr:folate-binding protein YgfZ [Chromatiaceae bacterium]